MYVSLFLKRNGKLFVNPLDSKKYFSYSLTNDYIDVCGQNKRVLLEAMKGIIPEK